MRVLKVKVSLSNEKIKANIRSHKSYNDIIDWLIVQAVQKQDCNNANEIAKVLGVSVNKIYKVIQDYNKSGENFKQNVQWGGRRATNCYLSKDEEKQVLEELRPSSLKGKFLTAKDIQTAFEMKIGHKVTQDYIWKVLRRNNWTKKTARPEHPKTDYEKQEDFKKNSQIIWQPRS